MSWYVKELTANNYLFYSNIVCTDTEIVNEDSPINLDAVFLDSNFNNDAYLDWLSVSKTFSELSNQCLITDDERVVYEKVKEGASLLQVSKEMKISLPTAHKLFTSVCSKIAFFLGEHFTNEGFISYMIEKYKLTQKQENKLRKIITKEK